MMATAGNGRSRRRPHDETNGARLRDQAEREPEPVTQEELDEHARAVEEVNDRGQQARRDAVVAAMLVDQLVTAMLDGSTGHVARALSRKVVRKALEDAADKLRRLDEKGGKR